MDGSWGGGAVGGRGCPSDVLPSLTTWRLVCACVYMCVRLHACWGGGLFRISDLLGGTWKYLALPDMRICGLEGAEAQQDLPARMEVRAGLWEAPALSGDCAVPAHRLSTDASPPHPQEHERGPYPGGSSWQCKVPMGKHPSSPTAALLCSLASDEWFL